MNEQMATATAGDRPGRREQNKAENRAALLKAARNGEIRGSEVSAGVLR